MELYGKKFEEVPTRKEMLRQIKKFIGKKFRGSLEKKNTGVYRVDKGSYDNRVLGFMLIDENKFYVADFIFNK